MNTPSSGDASSDSATPSSGWTMVGAAIPPVEAIVDPAGRQRRALRKVPGRVRGDRFHAGRQMALVLQPDTAGRRSERRAGMTRKPGMEAEAVRQADGRPGFPPSAWRRGRPRAARRRRGRHSDRGRSNRRREPALPRQRFALPHATASGNRRHAAERARRERWARQGENARQSRSRRPKCGSTMAPAIRNRQRPLALA